MTRSMYLLPTANMRCVLKECMESIECDVPMLTDGKTGPNWASLKKYED
jgi:hypothetical protein